MNKIIFSLILILGLSFSLVLSAISRNSKIILIYNIDFTSSLFFALGMIITVTLIELYDVLSGGHKK